MAGKEGKHNARKPSKASALQQIYSKPLKNGTGLEPRWSQEHYKGIPLHPHVKARMDQYAAIPSLSVKDIRKMLA